MNHVVTLHLWHNPQQGDTFLVAWREKGKMQLRTISDGKAESLACLVAELADRGTVTVAPFLVRGCYGWAADRVPRGRS